MRSSGFFAGLASAAVGMVLVTFLTDTVAAGQGEDRTAFLARCKRETIAQYPGAAAQADAICGSKWDTVAATAPLADTLLALAPATGAAFDTAGAAGRAATVRWAAAPGAGQVATGRLDDVDVRVTRSPVPGVAFGWFRNGEPIPFDLEEALRVRGANLAMIGCLDFGAAEGGRVYRVNAPGKAPFALTIHFRSAALASQSSDYQASADFSGRLPTLASLRKDGTEWAGSCAQ